MKRLHPVWIAFAFLPAVALHAQLLFNSDVYATGSTSTPGVSDYQDAMNLRSTSQQVSLDDTVKNQATGTASLQLDSGYLTAGTHACSGGGLAYGGHASAGGHATFTQAYRLVSPSLPIGTVVSIHFVLESKARATAGGDLLVGANDSDSAEVFLRFSMYDASSSLFSENGDLLRTNNAAGPDEVRAGDFRPDDDGYALNFNETIGSVITLSIEGFVAANSSAEPVAFADGDSQLAVVWGLTPGTADTMLVSDDSGFPLAPPAENATPDQALTLLPPRPPIMPEPSGLTAFALFYSLATTRRRRAP